MSKKPRIVRAVRLDDDKVRRELLRLVFVMAPHFQGGHSSTGDDVCSALDIPFPVAMSALEDAAQVNGFDPAELWPWYAKMKADQLAYEREHSRNG